jgi:WD40 repeat protein
VCSHPQDGSSIFASCSHDGMAVIWDTRNAKPARGMIIIYKNICIFVGFNNILSVKGYGLTGVTPAVGNVLKIILSFRTTT